MIKIILFRIYKARIICACLFLTWYVSVGQQQKAGWQIIEQKNKKQIDILADGMLLTSYCYYDSIRKPILFPINTISGISITRGYPIAPVAGERADHPHHTGLWLNYEFVNGLDFWNNSTSIPLKERLHYGTIRHDKIISSKSTGRQAELTVAADWITSIGIVLLKEETHYIFRKNGHLFIIDRITTLTALGTDVSFKDTKDGFLGLRVARELEMPSKEPLELTDIHGNVTKVSEGDNSATGLYLSSEGLSGDAVWGTRGRWCMLYGKKAESNISICIIDHPKNTGYPTYWHARGYGLFAANPLGQEIFSKGKEKLNFVLHARKSVAFRFRIVVASENKLEPQQINNLADEFASNF